MWHNAMDRTWHDDWAHIVGGPPTWIKPEKLHIFLCQYHILFPYCRGHTIWIHSYVGPYMCMKHYTDYTSWNVHIWMAQLKMLRPLSLASTNNKRYCHSRCCFMQDIFCLVLLTVAHIQLQQTGKWVSNEVARRSKVYVLKYCESQCCTYYMFNFIDINMYKYVYISQQKAVTWDYAWVVLFKQC